MENKEVVFDAVYRLSVAMDNIVLLDKVEELEKELADLGYTHDELKGINLYLTSNMPMEEYIEYMGNESISRYTDALAEVKGMMESQMAKGYMEMGEINLQIANENAQIIDNEGYDVSEMGTKDSKTGS